jgi:hypothetical protein
MQRLIREKKLRTFRFYAGVIGFAVSTALLAITFSLHFFLKSKSYSMAFYEGLAAFTGLVSIPRQSANQKPVKETVTANR